MTDAYVPLDDHGAARLAQAITPVPQPAENNLSLYADASQLRIAGDDGITATVSPLPSVSPRIDLAADLNTLFTYAPLGGVLVMQSHAWDNTTGDLYTAQIMDGGIQLDDEPAPVPYEDRVAQGALCISRLAADGTLLDYMYIRGFGHGVSFAVEPHTEDEPAQLWVEADPDPDTRNGYGRAITRFPYAYSAGAFIDSSDFTIFHPVSDSASMNVNIDPVHGRLAIAYHTAADHTNHWKLYELTDAIADRWTAPVADVKVPTPDLSGASLQGWTILGNYLYVLYGNPETENTTIVCYDLTADTTTPVATQLITYEPDLTYREPQGLSLRITDPAAPEQVALTFGFACGTGNHRTATLCSYPAAGAGVTRINGKSGDITLTATDVDALPITGGTLTGPLTITAENTTTDNLVVNGEVATFSVNHWGNPIADTMYSTGNMQIGSTAGGDYGGAKGALILTDTGAPPTSNPQTGGIILYAEGGHLKLRHDDGTVETLTIPIASEWVPLALGEGVTGEAFGRLNGDKVEIYGVLYKTDGFTVGDLIATLPEGHWPTTTQHGVWATSGSGVETLCLVRCDIGTTGSVVVYSQPGQVDVNGTLTASGTGGPYAWISLSGSFYKTSPTAASR
ncbi:hypothetical protein [Streptomyces fractus]|uniref:phage baseplate protein n=1 Tax=Streptomyces fractus TaxID=641806 RepID=UPI003CE7B0FD